MRKYTLLLLAISATSSALYAQELEPHAHAPFRATVTAGPVDSLPDSAIPEAARLRLGVPFDPAAATAAYLATVPPAERARSDAYVEGQYWIQLWSFLITVGIMLFLLSGGWSRGMRDWAMRQTRRHWAQTFLYYAAFGVAALMLSFPFTVYATFVREHHYGLARQGFGGWLRDQAIGWMLLLVVGGSIVTILYTILRRFPRRWPVIATGVATIFVVIGAAVVPVVIIPLFYKSTMLADARVRTPILQLARANGITADKIYVIEASRQSTRISANVTGLLGTQRISLNDNLLRRTSLPEIKAVMGHEMGHYVMLRHAPLLIICLTLLIGVGTLLLQHGFAWAAGRWGEHWGVRGIEDPAGMPLMVVLLSAYFFILTPIINTYVRSMETTADIFGLNAAR